MAVNVYDIGDSVLFRAAFTKPDGDVIDPSGVTLQVKKPDGTITEYVRGVASEIQSDGGTGRYRALIIVDAAGEWAYRWVGTGAAAAEERIFLVRQSGFVA